MKSNKRNRRQKIRWRIRNKVKGTTVRPRISVFRSNKAIYAQVIDDTKGQTLCSASSNEEAVDKSGTKIAQAAQVGQILGKRVVEAGINTVVFDRGGYLYHGRVKALADGAREVGLKF